MAKMWNLSLSQMKEIRRGILLAQHDHQHILFEANHKDMDEEIVEDMREVYAYTEKLIVGQGEPTDLTLEAYARTIETLRKRTALTSDQELE